ncbi:MAG: hypothetical protein ACLPLR_01760 [Terriglobales bacterium]
MNFWIVAIDHELQLQKDASDVPSRRTQKDHLEALLMSELPKRKIGFIAEESKPGKTTIAFVLANTNDPRIPWKNISMTDAERGAAGITEALKNRPGHPDYETMERWIESRIPEDVIREDFFIEQTLGSAGDVKSILMLLGDMHVNAVGEKLNKMGHNVSVNHDLFPVRRWE